MNEKTNEELLAELIKTRNELIKSGKNAISGDEGAEVRCQIASLTAQIVVLEEEGRRIQAEKAKRENENTAPAERRMEGYSNIF